LTLFYKKNNNNKIKYPGTPLTSQLTTMDFLAASCQFGQRNSQLIESFCPLTTNKNKKEKITKTKQPTFSSWHLLWFLLSLSLCMCVSCWQTYFDFA